MSTPMLMRRNLPLSSTPSLSAVPTNQVIYEHTQPVEPVLGRLQTAMGVASQSRQSSRSNPVAEAAARIIGQLGDNFVNAQGEILTEAQVGGAQAADRNWQAGESQVGEAGQPWAPPLSRGPPRE